MPNFSSLSRDDRAALAAYVAALPSGKAAAGGPRAKQLPATAHPVTVTRAKAA
ncbi:MAG: hypothetical protein U1E41_04910 [Paracoccus sp. (in: a-proteobacteria)]